MQAHPETSAETGSRRLLVAIVVALAAATVSAGVVLGHRPEAKAARLTADGVVPAAAAAPAIAAPRRDRSLPSADEVLEHAPASFDEPAPTF